jgi:hypothetical protein
VHRSDVTAITQANGQTGGQSAAGAHTADSDPGRVDFRQVGESVQCLTAVLQGSRVGMFWGQPVIDGGDRDVES